MPTTKPTPESPPTERLLLAAIDRAYRHRRRSENPGVRLASVKEHLGLGIGSASTRRLRPLWDGLHAACLIELSEARGQPLWRLTSAGVERLQAARKSGELVLPESPQHRHWREARSTASEQITSFRDELRAAPADAADLLVIEPPSPTPGVRRATDGRKRARAWAGRSIACVSGQSRTTAKRTSLPTRIAGGGTAGDGEKFNRPCVFEGPFVLVFVFGSHPRSE
jgi:hypothetical protein